MSTTPLQGIRIIDFGQIIAVPFAAQILAWLGAEVVLVEPRLDRSRRSLPPFAEGINGVNRSAVFNLVNSKKLNCSIDLTTPEGVELAKRLISISDVVMENYSTGTMEKFGLGYETVRRLRPDIIYLSLASFGRTGPKRDLVGFHSVANLFSGLAAVTGYPGGHPRILGGIFPDFFSGCYCLLAALEALYHRGQTGEGQYIEVTMTEAVTTLIPEAVIDYTLNGREAERVGNRDRAKAPHNVYPCEGEQKWVAISVSTDAQFVALCQVAGHPEWAKDTRFSDAANRWRNQETLDLLIESWTRTQEPTEAMTVLQAAGVAAAPTLNSSELLSNPHLVERGFVAWTDHPEVGRRAMSNLSWSIDGNRPVEYPPAPLAGEHSRYVLEELLDLSQDEIKRLTDAGIVA